MNFIITSGIVAATLLMTSPAYAFGKGQCTDGADKIKGGVTWTGDAKDWFANAKAKGISTGSAAKPGAIVVWGGNNVNGGHGHVGVVQTDGVTYRAMNDWNSANGKTEEGKYVNRKINDYASKSNKVAILGYVYYCLNRKTESDSAKSCN